MSVQHYKNGQLSIIAGAGGIGGGGGECDCENKTFTGTTAEVEQAIADGVIKDDYIVNITDDVTAGAADIDVLDSYEEIMANTEEGKAAGALGVKEGFAAVEEGLTNLTNDIQTVDDKLGGFQHKVVDGMSQASFDNGLNWTPFNIFMPYRGVMGETTDFNSMQTMGVYSNGGTNKGQANAPHSADNGYLYVFGGTSKTRQIWIGTYAGAFSTRFYNGSTWSAWTNI